MNSLITILVQAIFLIVFSVNNAHANFKTLDKIFLEEGVVDKNYKYLDEKLAAAIFTELNNGLANSLPAKTNAYSEISSVFHAPRFAIYYYKIDIQGVIGRMPTDGFIKYLQQYFTSPEMTRKFCDDVFGAKFQQVNGYTFTIHFNDLSGKKITTITLNEKTCPLLVY